MIVFTGRGIVVDIEGTTSSIRFVTDVLFPFARERLASFLERRGGDADVRAACDRIAQEAGMIHPVGTDWIIAEVNRLMDVDVKSTGLKSLQGLIWEEGYLRGELRSPVYPEVPPALREWRRRGRDVRVYSSGSVAAQKSFFAHTDFGDLLPEFLGHYDTTTGPKRESNSYRKIASDMGLSPDSLLFLSDVVAELDAAAAAGWATGLVDRPGNAPAPDRCSHPRITSFDQIEIRD